MQQLDLLPAAPTTRPPTSNYLRPLWIGERLPAVHTDAPGLCLDYWHSHVTRHPFFDPDKEHLVALLLNTKMRCFAWNMISIGSLNEATAHPREIFRPVIAAAAYAFVLMHNHPSGDTTPSDADTRLTRRLKEGSELLNLRLVDHVIAGRLPSDRHFSFRESGCL